MHCHFFLPILCGKIITFQLLMMKETVTPHNPKSFKMFPHTSLDSNSGNGDASEYSVADCG